MADSYGKRPLWQWIVIYLIIGAVVYGLIYYFVLAKKGGVSYNNSQQTPNTNQQASSAPLANNTIQISNFAFSPNTLTIKVGDTVTWTNKDNMDHSATADDGSFDTGLVSEGQTGSVTFNKSGTYTYHCKVHSYMQGTIIVK